LTSQPEVVDCSNWRIVGSVLGQVWFTDFNLVYIEHAEGLELLVDSPEVAAFARE
jgi:hypothetical protein